MATITKHYKHTYKCMYEKFETFNTYFVRETWDRTLYFVHTICIIPDAIKCWSEIRTKSHFHGLLKYNRPYVVGYITVYQTHVIQI